MSFRVETEYLMQSTADSDGGELVGRLPNEIEITVLKALGGPTTPMKALRSKCIDCSGGNATEVRKCTAIKCDLWPYRMGFNPFYGKNE